MIGNKTRGFTIIEVLLFLSISGVLFAALMVGVSTNINQQRYRDSVTSFAGVLQQQYSEVANTRNDRDDSWRCAASVATQDPENGTPRGTTNCVVMGKYIQTTENATKLEIGNIIGSEPAGDTVIDGDATALSVYAPRPSTFEVTTYSPEWGAVLRDTDEHPANFTILILRSPLSGLVRTFAIAGTMPSRLTDMMTTENANRKITTCVIPNGWTIGSTLAVVVDSATAGPNGVSTTGDDNAC